MDRLTKQLKQYEMHNIRQYDTDFLKIQLPNGSFSDLDYQAENRANWAPAQHCIRIKVLAIDYARHHDPVVGDAIVRGLSYWFTLQPKSSNWWYNALGVPQQLRVAGLLSWDLHSASVQEALIHTLQSEIPAQDVGANRLWYAENVAYRGILTHSESMVRYALGEMAKLSRVAASPQQIEGILNDFSFTQHGKQLYNWGYGICFLLQMIQWLCVTHETAFAFDEETLQTITDLMLEGNRWMMRYGFADLSARGREIVRDYREEFDLYLLREPCKRLENIQHDTRRKDALRQMREHLDGKRPNPGTTGNHLFHQTAFMTHSTDAFYASVRLPAEGVHGSETLNGENLRGGYLSHGLTCLVRTGKEYDKIFGCWDWGHLPGVTCPAKPESPNAASQAVELQ